MTKKPTYEELEKRIRKLEIADSKHKQAMNVLLDSEHKLSIHLLNTPIGALSWDLDFKIIEWNPAAETIFGYSKAEAMGKHPSEIILPQEMKELCDDIFQKLISEKGGTRSTNENITKDGKLILCDWYNTPLKNIDGEVIGVASLVHDITERTKTFESLKEQKEFNEKIVQISQAIIVGLDKNHIIKIFNKGAEKITGFKAKEVLGRDWFEIFFKSDIYDEMDNVWETAWGAEFNSYINPILSKNGDEKIISWQTTGMYEDKDESKHILLSIGEDITKRQQTEDKIKYSKLQFEAVLNNLDSVIYITDMKSNEILFMNQHMKDKFEKDLTGKICWQVFHKNKNGPCEFCTNDKLIDADGTPKKPYVWEFYNTKLQLWHELRDQAIPWTDGRLVRMEIATDITDRKKTENALRESEEKYRSMMESMKA
ncbi:MAG: PAS domain-containing protein, partial [Desulfobacterales bacterium]|nr:PAS domain-containing protein [Desulfobacterales bacterium]